MSTTHADKTSNNAPRSPEDRGTGGISMPAVQLKPVQPAPSVESAPPVQKKENDTGLPDQLKSGIENLSGYSMDDVNVHYNSAKPAELQALAYAQGTDIHIAPGQERHLPHEAWHVVQQKEGRVTPTVQLKGQAINDNTGLEQEADIMGNKAMQMKVEHPLGLKEGMAPVEIVQKGTAPVEIVQRKVGFEFQTGWQIVNQNVPIAMTALTKNDPLIQGVGWKLTRDDGDAEFVTEAFEEGDINSLMNVFVNLRAFTEALVKRSGEAYIPSSDFPGATFLGKTTAIQPGNAAMPANPQMTAGIDLAKISELMKQMGNRDHPQNSKYIGARQTLMKELGNLPKYDHSPEYSGLVKLMASYVHLSSSLAGYADTPKNITTLMSRTSFALAYALTPEASGDLPAGKKAMHLLWSVIAAVKAISEPTRTFGPVGPDMHLVPPSPEAFTQGQEKGIDSDILALELRSGPTLYEWVEGIVLAGVDRLSGLKAVSNVSMGSKGTEEVSPIKRPNGEFSGIHRKEGVMLEFRDLKKNIPQAIWGDWAYALMSWITAINEEGSKNTELPERGNEVSMSYARAHTVNELRKPLPPDSETFGVPGNSKLFGGL